jgi:hypothetical protein
VSTIQRKNITLLLRPGKEFAVLEDDQVMYLGNIAAKWTNSTALRPGIRVQSTGAGAARRFQVSKIRLDLIHN